jgi:4-hydroxy-2-oxoheptanedioate aldolase
MTPSLRSRLDADETLIGTLHDFIDPTLIEVIGLCGFDFVMLEYEHGLRSLQTIQDLIRAAETASIPALVRIGTADGSLISRLFEAGAAGVMVAHIKTAAEAETIVRAARYPPAGTRGQGYPRRDRLWKLGPDSASADAQANRDAIIIAIIEDPEGVENIDDILAVDGLTGVAPGPADLAAALGNVALDDPAVTASLNAVRTAVRSRGDRIMLDLVVRPEDAPALAAGGSQLLMWNHDVILIGDFYEDICARTKSAMAASVSDAGASAA